MVCEEFPLRLSEPLLVRPRLLATGIGSPASGSGSEEAPAVGALKSESALPATLSKSASALTSRSYSSYASSSRGSSFGGANAYARTQDLSERHPIIDTYA